MKKNLKTAEEKTAKTNNKGITLIALVVTIVVLLILAGITINAILSEGGILNTAKNAQKVQEEATAREKVQVMLADAQLENIVNDKTLEEYLNDNKEKNGIETITDNENGTITIVVEGYEITIDEETFQITEMKKTNASDEGSGDNTGSGEGETTVAVTGVSLNKTSASIPNGGTVTLEATIAPENATNTELTWTSEDEEVATVGNGVVEALKVGNTKITVTTTDGSYTAECNITVESTVADLIGQEASSTNTYTQDKYGNKIVIPANFKVLGNGTQSVVYDYDKNEEGTSTNVPVVQDGIVIQHATDLNEFVWVPVGEIKNDAVENTTNKTTITLGRYEDFTMDTTTTPPTLPTPKQVANKDTYDVTTSDDLIKIGTMYQYFENTTGTYSEKNYPGARFETLGTWIENTIENGGYYIGRYEASYGANEIARSQTSTGTPVNDTFESTTETVEKTIGQLWNYVKQEEASIASKAMYQTSENLGYYSELLNSYAWDTAIVFIQTYEDVDYASQKSLISSPGQPANTGERGEDASIGANTTDKVCNIYDMASNCWEWTTEIVINTFIESGADCVYRGGSVSQESFTSLSRYYGYNDNRYNDVAFRPLLNCNAES